jgi:hypothetical protein
LGVLSRAGSAPVRESARAVGGLFRPGIRKEPKRIRTRTDSISDESRIRNSGGRFFRTGIRLKGTGAVTAKGNQHVSRASGNKAKAHPFKGRRPVPARHDRTWDKICPNGIKVNILEPVPQSPAVLRRIKLLFISCSIGPPADIPGAGSVPATGRENAPLPAADTVPTSRTSGIHRQKTRILDSSYLIRFLALKEISRA